MGKLLKFNLSERRQRTRAPRGVDTAMLRRVLPSTLETLSLEEARSKVRSHHAQLATRQHVVRLARQAAVASKLAVELTAVSRQLPSSHERYRLLLAETLRAQAELVRLERERRSSIEMLGKHADRVFCRLYRQHIGSHIH